ncbi:MAG: hypothetical protein WC614_03580 [bacterium]
MIKQNIGFFESCSREVDDTGTKLIFRPRVELLAEKFNKLYDVASKANIPFLFTICCGVRMLEKNILSDILFIPMCPKDDKWTKYVKDYRQFYIQKNATNGLKEKDLKKNDYFDTFKHNSNAVKLVKMLNVSEWIVFGNSLGISSNFCVNNSILSLIRMGQKVTLLTDVLIRSAKGYDNTGTEKNYSDLMNEFKELGVSMTTLEEFLKSL